MKGKAQLIEAVREGYSFEGDALDLGAVMYEGTVSAEGRIRLPLRTLNRHGLIAGATGTGKTKTLQVLAEQLSLASVPVLMMDIKGDLSGIAAPSEGHPKIDERQQKIDIPWIGRSFPVELFSLSEEPGAKLRATVSEFGPVLMSKILGLNDTQGGILALIFKFCDDHQLPLLDLKDLKKALQWVSNEGKKELEKEYGRISAASAGTILRKVVELEQQGGESFFGERSFETDDLLRINDMGLGYISLIRLTDMQDRPKLFSTFMLSLLAEIYGSFPEEGDPERPKLVIFIDEAHLIFDEASDALLDQIETIVRLIRSKGVGVFFCTQSPDDIPESVLGQLGLKVQHALRAFTAKDRKRIRMAAENFPLTDFYETDELLTQLGIGEALVTGLNEKGIPTPLVHCMLRAPMSRMDILEEAEIRALVQHSRMVSKYNEEIDRESAYEMLSAKMEAFEAEEKQAELRKEQEKARKSSSRKKSPIDKAVESAGSSVIREVSRELTRGLLGVFGLGGRSRGRSRSRKRNSLF